jgi:hypothetical protein
METGNGSETTGLVTLEPGTTYDSFGALCRGLGLRLEDAADHQLAEHAVSALIEDGRLTYDGVQFRAPLPGEIIPRNQKQPDAPGEIEPKREITRRQRNDRERITVAGRAYREAHGRLIEIRDTEGARAVPKDALLMLADLGALLPSYSRKWDVVGRSQFSIRDDRAFRKTRKWLADRRIISFETGGKGRGKKTRYELLTHAEARENRVT